MGDGSRWYFPVYEGLFAAEHCEKMGQALWLYGWIVARAHVAQAGGIITYNHETAAQELGKSKATIRAWFATLQEHGYISTRARKPYHLEVQVSKWRTVEEWWEARGTRQDGQILGTLGGESARESVKESARNPAHVPLTITLSHYEDPSGAPSAPTSLVGAFRALEEQLKNSENRPAVLREIYQLCFGDTDLPEYGYIGRAAKAVGGAGRLAQMMWESTARPPTGDPLAYFMAVAKRERGRRNAQPDDDGTPRGKAAQAAWIAQKEAIRGI